MFLFVSCNRFGAVDQKTERRFGQTIICYYFIVRRQIHCPRGWGKVGLNVTILHLRLDVKEKAPYYYGADGANRIRDFRGSI